MIVAYPLTDINSMAGKKTKTSYQKAGIPTRVIAFINNVAILENGQGVKFPTNKSNIVWHDTGL